MLPVAALAAGDPSVRWDDGVGNTTSSPSRSSKCQTGSLLGVCAGEWAEPHHAKVATTFAPG